MGFCLKLKCNDLSVTAVLKGDCIIETELYYWKGDAVPFHL